MRQCGTVISTDKNKAKVLLQRQSACGDCKGCRWGDDDMSMELEAVNAVNAKEGDSVQIDMEHQDVLKAAFIAYVIPLITLIGGVIIGSMLLESIGLDKYKEIGSGLFGLLLTGISYLVIRSREKVIEKNKNYIPIIREISNN